MTLILPNRPAPRRMNIKPVSSRNELKPEFGGDVLRLNRKGTKYSADIEMPVMTYATGNDFTDLEGEDETVAILIRQPGVDTGAPGSPVVDGNGQAGMSLTLRNVTPNYAFGRGWYLSHIQSTGRMRLYKARADAVADGFGVLTIPLRTMLRYPPADGDLVELARPMIEGYATIPDDLRDVDALDRLVRMRFTITERG